MKKVALLACMVSLVPGCLGTETGNPPFTASLTIDAHSSDPSYVAIRVDEGGAVVEEAWLTLGELTFDAEDACAAPSADAPRVPAIGAADHAEAEAAHASFEVLEDRYCRARVPFLRAVEVPTGAPPELASASIVLLGESASGTPFVLVSDVEAEVGVEALDAAGFSLSPDEAGLFLGFDLATWLADVDLEGATVAGDGRIHIDASENAALLDAFEAQLASGLELYRDLDGDGRPDGTPAIARGAP